MKPPKEHEETEGYADGGRKKRKRRAAGGSASGPLAAMRLDQRPRRNFGGGGLPGAGSAMMAPQGAAGLGGAGLGGAGLGAPGLGGPPGLAAPAPAMPAMPPQAMGPYRRGGRANPKIAAEAREEGESYAEEAAEQKAGMKGGGRLTAGERQSLPKSDFALPGKGKGPKGAGAGSYPVNDKNHARNALARVSQHGSASEKAAVRGKVHAKYPNIAIGE